MFYLFVNNHYYILTNSFKNDTHIGTDGINIKISKLFSMDFSNHLISLILYVFYSINQTSLNLSIQSRCTYCSSA